MNYIERYALTESDLFKRRLQMAIWIAAIDVTNEPASTPEHAKRLAWANKILRGLADVDVMRKIAIRASANATIGTAGDAATDSDIQFVINGLVNEIT